MCNSLKDHNCCICCISIIHWFIDQLVRRQNYISSQLKYASSWSICVTLYEVQWKVKRTVFQFLCLVICRFYFLVSFASRSQIYSVTIYFKTENIYHVSWDYPIEVLNCSSFIVYNESCSKSSTTFLPGTLLQINISFRAPYMNLSINRIMPKSLNKGH